MSEPYPKPEPRARGKRAYGSSLRGKSPKQAMRELNQAVVRDQLFRLQTDCWFALHWDEAPPDAGSCRGPHDPHHKLPRGQGGKDSLDNEVRLCRRHHDYVHEVNREWAVEHDLYRRAGQLGIESS